MNRGGACLRGSKRRKWPLERATVLALARSRAALVTPRARGEYRRERLAKPVPALAARVRRVGVLVARVAACTSSCK